MIKLSKKIVVDGYELDVYQFESLKEARGFEDSNPNLMEINRVVLMSPRIENGKKIYVDIDWGIVMEDGIIRNKVHSKKYTHPSKDDVL